MSLTQMNSNLGNNKESFVIGLDCSTTSTKAIVFDRNGNVVAHSSEAIPLFSPQPNYYEQNPNDWWVSAQKALKAVTYQLDPSKIVALAISNQRETFIALDKNGNPLRPAIIWLDERCKDEVENFAKKVGHKKIHSITGKPVDYAPVVYRLAWMKKHEPALFRKIGMICDVNTYFVWKFTGKFRTSWASADPLGLFDLKNKKWSSTILKALQLTDNQLPETFCPGSIIGRISEEATKLTGLSTNTIIVAGGGDGQAAGLGSDVLSSKRAYLNLGTAVVMGIYGSKYQVSKAFRTMNACSESGYYYECSLRAGTFAIDWFIKNILKINPMEQSDIYNQLEKEAKEVSPGSGELFYIPYLSGAMNPYWNINAKGAFIGLTASHTRGHMYRSILEGIAFEQLFAINAVEKSIGKKVNDLVVIGGGVNNISWLHILADITGRNICLLENAEASAAGAAISAAVGAGWYKTFNEAANKMSRVKRIIKPNKLDYKKYQQLFEVYKKIYPALKKMKTISN
jgi:sugar (pentulose or hexulose) kinase